MELSLRAQLLPGNIAGQKMDTAPASSPGSAAQATAPSSAAASSIVVVIPAAPAASASAGSTPTPTTIAITLTTPAQQPISLWDNGTVHVAGFALLGVVLSPFAAHYRMRRELQAAAIEANVERDQTRAQADMDRKHDALEAHKERLATTRRQVYLEAVEALGKAQMFLGGLAKQDLTKLDSSQGLGPLQIAVNRVAVVGEMDTVGKERELTALMNQRFIKAIIQLLPLGVAESSAVFHHAQWW